MSIIIYQLTQRNIPETINLQPTPMWEFQISKISNITWASYDIEIILEHDMNKMNLNYNSYVTALILINLYLNALINFEN